ncbi:MAG TPA: cyclic nucleotide-binding domain-containing protein [Leptospiraceae bacterium]|nr:cyclic nucleotide-binding domain-containing protein [Leptospiraceae bacterium]HMY68752.1 cyclic nucleotide-binding domain-containing protein [Leptospiraceae bacterium]HMZ57726.1 cyclic nucleotide-binding domain-containing protein [Leptospiraceae bacterium]HNF13521.1 cyclic nucleotide-binding domain-containing protein [Leptospiraceae bacterium]HNF27609.1 cyclic nucleotide-binding domain-containing protein [Leptospiraceae bacterium]
MAAIVSVKAGKYIFKEGDSGTSMYIVMEGVVDIHIVINGEETNLAVMKQGDFFGEMALFREKPRSASARVMQDVRLAVIESRAQLEKFLCDNPLFAAKMVNIMASRLAQTNDMLFQKISELSAKRMEYK